jgi:hypothetical protein
MVKKEGILMMYHIVPSGKTLIATVKKKKMNVYDMT